MKKAEWNEGMNHLDPSLVEDYIEEKNRLRQAGRKPKILWLRVGVIAACLALMATVLVLVPMMLEDEPTVPPPTFESQDEPTVSPPTFESLDEPTVPPPTFESQEDPETYPESGTEADTGRPNIPIVNVQIPSSAPQYFGSASSNGSSGSVQGEVRGDGLSVTAQLIETLPDTYTFFDDWKQYEYRLLRMKTVKLLKGQEMTDEFYYMIPVNFMTDYSIYDSFIIKDMAQFGYDYSVMYNQTKGQAEQLHLPLFGYRVYGYNLMGENFIAFDADGNFDERLWSANEAWIEGTKHAPDISTLKQEEDMILQKNSHSAYKDLYVHLLDDISGEAANVLTQIKSFENGLFVPTFSSIKLFLSPEVQFHAIRYINGFATNEKVSVWCKEWTGGEQDTYAYTKARFSEEDMSHLPDLSSAFESIKGALNDGSVKPPHFDNQEKIRNTTSGIFGWYAKTENSVIGIIRVSWCFWAESYERYYDDAYYIIEYGSDEYKAIDHDELLEKLGEYEKTYIYTGEYDEYGKTRDRYAPVA